MKKNKFIYALSLSFLFTSLVSCNPSNSDSSIESSSTNQVSKVEINGANTLQVGQQTTLVANTDVTWESSDTSIATIDSQGKVVALEQGEVIFTATSKLDSSLKATHTITISYKLPKQEHLLFKFEGEGVSFDSTNNKYILPLGREVKCSIKTAQNYKTPSVSFSLSFSDSSQSTSIVSLENLDQTSCLLTGNGDISGVTISANCSFDEDSSNNVKISADFDVVDLNATNKQNLFAKLDSTVSKETSSLLNANIISTISTTNLNTNIKEEDKCEYQFNLFNNASYLKLDDNGVVTNYYSGIKDNKYFLFSYDSNFNITKFISSNAISSQNDYSKQANSTFYLGNNTSYSLSGLIQDLFDASISLGDNLINFGNSTCYANSVFTINENRASVSSSFNEDDISYNLNLNINFENNGIKDFEFSQTSISSNLKVEAKLASSNLSYGQKQEDNSTSNPSYLDFSKYYFNKLNTICLAGTKNEGVYDYSDTSKYGGIDKEYDSNSKTYTLPIYKSLPLKIDDSLGNCGIDEVKVSANNTEIEVPTITSDGILLFSAKSERELQEDGTYKAVVKEGKTTFTLTSSKNNISYSFTVVFKNEELTSLEISDNKPSNNDFGNVHKNEYSSYFSLKNSLDNVSDYSYEIVNENNQLIPSLSIYQYQDGNIDGISSFSYSIIGTEVGTYNFKIRAKGTSVTTEVYTINITAPISKQTLIDNLVGKKFVKKGDTTSQEIEFVSETELKIAYTDIGGNKTSASIKITFKEGGVYVDELDDTISGYKGQKINNFYYAYIYGGKLSIDDDYSKVRIYLADSNGAYYNVEFGQDSSSKIDYENLPTYLNGKSFTNRQQMGSMVDTTLTFGLNSGNLKLINSLTLINIDIDFTFTYSYLNGYGNFVVSSSTTSSDYKVTSIYLNSDDTIRIKIENSNELSWTFDFSLLANVY